MGGVKLEILTFDFRPNYRYPLVGDQIAAEAPQKHSLRIEAHNCAKCIKVLSKPTHFSMHRQIHKQLPILEFNCIVC